MSYNVNLNNNIKHNTIKRSKTVCGIRQKKQIGHLQSLSVGLSKSYGKLIKPTWSEKYNKLSKNNDLVLDELLGTKYSLIQVKDYIDRKISKYNHILPVNNNDLVLELKEYKSLNSKLKNDLSEIQNCKICFSKKMDVLCRPCNHLCLCSSCSKKCSKCPICRKDVKKYLKIFVS
tara:strand:+ start:3012 stop:3536 length:525 start_codon:yes stop_codon:yes gene_type:complete